MDHLLIMRYAFIFAVTTSLSAAVFAAQPPGLFTPPYYYMRTSGPDSLIRELAASRDKGLTRDEAITALGSDLDALAQRNWYSTMLPQERGGDHELAVFTTYFKSFVSRIASLVYGLPHTSNSDISLIADIDYYGSIYRGQPGLPIEDILALSKEIKSCFPLGAYDIEGLADTAARHCIAKLFTRRSQGPVSAATNPPQLINPKHEYVSSVSFYTVTNNYKANRFDIKETLRVPYEIGSRYCWQVDLSKTYTDQRIGLMRYREEITAPLPKIWKSNFSGEYFRISNDGRTATTDVNRSLRSPFSQCREIEHGDPFGRYSIKAFFDEKPAIIVEFDLE